MYPVNIMYDVLYCFMFHVEPICCRSPLKKRSMISMGPIWLNKGLKLNEIKMLHV